MTNRFLVAVRPDDVKYIWDIVEPLIKKALNVVDKLVVAVSNDYSKEYLFSAESIDHLITFNVSVLSTQTGSSLYLT